jgi:adiponectin receptor
VDSCSLGPWFLALWARGFCPWILKLWIPHRFNGLLPFEAQHGLKVWPIVVFLLSACFCLFTSASYHLFNCHSRQLNDVLLLLDYVGISVLIAGSFYPPIFYGFYCKTSFLYLYLAAVSIISVSSAIVGVYSGLNPSKFWRLARVLCYSANACFGILPCAHLAILQFSGEPSWPPAIIYIGAMLGIYAFGTAIYTFQFPEKYFPGTFDYFFSSHQLWHILVFAAAFLHYFCAVGHYRWRSHAMECPVA